MAVDPRQVVNEVARRAHRLGPDDPPPLLRRPPGVGAPLPPVQQDEDVAAIHRDWAAVHAEEARTAGGASGDAGAGAAGAARGAGAKGGGAGGLLARAEAKARARLVPPAASPAAQQADRALIGDLIRAVDALARRVDEIGGRLLTLEALVEEVVVITGEDLARVRAAVATGQGGAGDRQWRDGGEVPGPSSGGTFDG